MIKGAVFPWESPFEQSIDAILLRRGTPVVVLASGDPFLYGVGATLSRRVAPDEMRTIPAPSAFSLAASRLGWPLQDVAVLSLHGRPIDLVRPHLHEGRRIIALTSDERGPADLAHLLTGAGFGQSRLIVLEALGGDRERMRSTIAADFEFTDIDALNVCAVQVIADKGARILPFTPGIDDALFEHDGQITKREVRAMTLSALGPRHGELLWDIGAGAGSIGIEWMLADPSLRAIAIEQSAERAARISHNAVAFGVPGLAVVEGPAPDVLAGLPAPDVIFIGGGGTEPGVLATAINALKGGGRLVANAVTLDMEIILLAEHVQRGGVLTRIEIARAAPVGGMSGWRPAMPVTQWCWTKD